MKNKIISILIFGLISCMFFYTSDALAYTLLEKIPGIPAEATFPQYITGLHKFAIGIVSLAALLMLTIGGFSYMTSAGNQAQVGTSKKLITDAILGLIVVFVSWLVLYTINPDLLSADPGTINAPTAAEITNAQKGKATQRDVHCSNGATLECENSKEECESKYGSGSCDSLNNAVDDKEFLGVGEDGSTTLYETETDCIANGEITCVRGSSYKADMSYGTEEVNSRINLESDSKVEVSIDAKTDHMTERTMQDVKKLSNSVGEIDIKSVSKDGKIIDLGTTSTHVLAYAKANDLPKMLSSSWGIKGDVKYYKIDKGENKGIIVSYGPKRNVSLIMPKEDGSSYTLEELGAKSNSTAYNTGTESVPDAMVP